MLFIVILNILLICILPAKSEYYLTFAAKDVRLLNDGNIIPIPAFGTAVPPKELYDLPQAVFWAIESGYRTIDTDVNEDLVGVAVIDAIKCGLVTREDLFIIARLPLDVGKGKRVVPALTVILKRLQLDYIDLFIVNSPLNLTGKKNFDILDIWRGMEEAKQLGLTKSIGVGNFKREDLKLILPYCTTKPAVNQIEVNPTFTNIELVDYCQKQAIIVMAYGPFGFTVPRPGVGSRPPPALNDPVLVKIANKYGVTTSQIVLRYSIDRGTIPISRSTNEEHIQTNRDILNISLTEEEVDVISSFNKNRPVYPTDKTTLLNEYNMKMEYANRRNKKLF